MKKFFLFRLWSRPRPPVESASCCARGYVRVDNQDHIMIRRERLTFCVADGMGGGNAGDVASGIVCSEVARIIARCRDFGKRVRACADAIRAANTRIRAYADAANFRQMGSTFALLAMNPDDLRTGVVGHVGDSRVYRFRDGQLESLTHDHTMVGELSRAHATRLLAEQTDYRRHPLAHMLTRAVGIESEVHPEWRKIDVRANDVFLICSDGVYDMIGDKDMCELLLAGGAAREMVARLSDAVLRAGAEDNYSMIVVKVKPEAT